MFHCWPESLSRYNDSLLDRWSGDLIPTGARFFIPVTTEPETQPPSCTIGTVLIPGVNGLGVAWSLKPSAFMPSLRVNYTFYISLPAYRIQIFFSQYKLCVLMHLRVS